MLDPDTERSSPKTLNGATGRLPLVVDAPDAVVATACEACAVEMLPVQDEHGWRLRRIVDPFGHEWKSANQWVLAARPRNFARAPKSVPDSLDSHRWPLLAGE